MVIDRILMRIQLVFYTSGILMTTISTVTLTIPIISMCFFIVAIFLKVARIIRFEQHHELIKSQIAFYIPYLLTVFYLIFFLKSVTDFKDQQELNNFKAAISAVLTVSYSFFSRKKLSSKTQIKVYSFGLAYQIILLVQDTIFTVEIFDTQVRDELLKDFQLLTTSTGIAMGTLVLDIMFRTWEKLQDDDKMII